MLPHAFYFYININQLWNIVDGQFLKALESCHYVEKFVYKIVTVKLELNISYQKKGLAYFPHDNNITIRDLFTNFETWIIKKKIGVVMFLLVLTKYLLYDFRIKK